MIDSFFQKTCLILLPQMLQTLPMALLSQEEERIPLERGLIQGGNMELMLKAMVKESDAIVVRKHLVEAFLGSCIILLVQALI